MPAMIPGSGGELAHFGFAKLIVHDLDKTADFYRDVCGLVEWQRLDKDVSETSGGPISEITYRPTEDNGPSLTLLKFLDASSAVKGEMVLGFITPDIEAFLQRTKTAGGRVARPIKSMPEHKLKVAFVEDPEGHLIEVVQMG